MEQDPRFRTTRWSLVLSASRTLSEEDARIALEQLCEAYWYPVFTFISRTGRSREDALDLTQGFFANFIETRTLGAADPTRGRFRSFLLATVKQHLSHERDKARAIKRGGKLEFISLDALTADELAHPGADDAASPELAYEKAWALTALGRAKAKLASELAASGKEEQYRLLGGHLSGDANARPYAEIARRLGSSDAAVKMAVKRLRQRFGKLLREEIAQTVESEADVDSEVRHLLEVI